MTKQFKPDLSRVTPLKRKQAPAVSLSDNAGFNLTAHALRPLNSRVRLFRDAFAAADVRHSLLLASTFRSGSTYVAEVLRHNGLDGLSLEKFNDIWQSATNPDRAFRKAVSEILRTSETGLFTSKIMWSHRNDLAKCLRLERGDAGSLAESFPQARWLWVKRRDKVRQGISYWRARKTGRWHVFDDSPEPDIGYDFDEIRESYAELLTHDVCWEDFFAQTGIVPLVIDYDSFCEDVPDQLRKVLRFIGRPAGKDIATAVALKKQRDAFTEEIYDRFMNDCHRYG
jgi:LPS sulfotransferase NodH